MSRRKQVQDVIAELKDSFDELLRYFKWHSKKLEQSLKALGPAEVRRTLKCQAQDLAGIWKVQIKGRDQEEKADEQSITAVLAAVVLFMVVGFLFNI